MKCIGVTQRVDVAPQTGERRDGLDQRWTVLAKALGFGMVPLPNMDAAEVDDYLAALRLDGLILSGGNSLSYLDPMAADAAPERDGLERRAIRFALDNGIPVLGICRGMQMLNHYFEGELKRIDGHVATTHAVAVCDDYADLIDSPVNSYHNWAIPPDKLGRNLKAIAHDEAGNVEAFVHGRRKVAGIMWHPEREAILRAKNLRLLEGFLT